MNYTEANLRGQVRVHVQRDVRPAQPWPHARAGALLRPSVLFALLLLVVLLIITHHIIILLIIIVIIIRVTIIIISISIIIIISQGRAGALLRPPVPKKRSKQIHATTKQIQAKYQMSINFQADLRNKNDPLEKIGAEDYTPEFAKVKFSWKAPVNVHRKLQVTIHWESDNPFGKYH